MSSAPTKSNSHSFATLAELQGALPPLWHEDERVLQLRCATLAARANGRASLPVVDDDPTGTQTVHSVPVVADWDVASLVPVLSMDRPCFYVLANTRALVPSEACSRAEEIGRRLRAAAHEAGVGPLSAVVSRSDSTLRGHYPSETDALARGLGWGCEDGEAEAPTTVLAPFFAEGGRLTAGDLHYVAGPPGSGEDGSARLTLAGETEFARDRAFGYRASNLADWVAERHAGGCSPVPHVISVGLEIVRCGGPVAVAEIVTAAPAGSVVIANSVVPRDMMVIGLGCLQAELVRGPRRPLLYRSAGGLVAARAAIPPRPLLSASELALAGRTAGLVVVGSYVGKSSEQLAMLLRGCPWLVVVELCVAAFAGSAAQNAATEEECRAKADVIAALAHGESVVLHTSREVLQDDGAGGLHIGAGVTRALCAIVGAALASGHPPSFLVAKGGITSNDIAVHSLGVRRAEVLGAVVPGVPVWRCGAETKAPGLAYVVFPGNVGAKDDLARVVRKMSGRQDGPAGILDILRAARSRPGAVGAFRVCSLEGAAAVAEAVQSAGKPAVLQIQAGGLGLGGLALLAACRDLAARCSVPIAVQVGPTGNEQEVAAALEAGAEAIAVDGSHLPPAEYEQWARKLALLAHGRGVFIEAGLGKLGQEAAAEFVATTGVDAVSVADAELDVGGKLNVDKLGSIRGAIGDVPLGVCLTSGLAESVVRAAIGQGVCSVSFPVEKDCAMVEAPGAGKADKPASLVSYVEQRIKELTAMASA
mmetsp:Transcript_21309/g.61586  ORF Transcript_21309/g.61586 Transcript_21309/m.61586 type:complete len:763 (+) Transcript_21309:43-2331(+)